LQRNFESAIKETRKRVGEKGRRNRVEYKVTNAASTVEVI
jgi:hypothetical protein